MSKLHFHLLHTKSTNGDRRFAFGGLKVAEKHLLERRLKTVKEAAPPVFVVPNFPHTVMRTAVLRHLDCNRFEKKIDVQIGGRHRKQTLECAVLSYFIIDDHGNQSVAMTSEVCFSNDLVDRLIAYFSDDIGSRRQIKEQLFEVAGIISWEHLIRSGHSAPKVDKERKLVVVERS